MSIADDTAATPAPDYSLTGTTAPHAIETRLAAAEWYHTGMPRRTMKALMQRRDGPAIPDKANWAMLHVRLAAGGIAFWGSWVAAPFWLAYAVLNGSACDSRWHECGHGAGSRTGWMNGVVHQTASFQVMRNTVSWRWSHARHDTDTIIAGRDAEMGWMHPIKLAVKAIAYVRIDDVWRSCTGLSAMPAGCSPRTSLTMIERANARNPCFERGTMWRSSRSCWPRRWA